MLNLFDYKGKEIEHQIINNIHVFNIKEDIKKPIEMLAIDDKEIEINVFENVKALIYENDYVDTRVVYNLNENSELFNNMISLENGGKINRVINVSNNAKYHCAVADFSSSNVSMNMMCNLNGEYAQGMFKLSTLVKDNNSKVFDINFIHNNPNTTSLMENYGVVRDESNLAFVGVCHIKEKCKKSKANQSAKIMVFDPKCKASASPILKIDENDVFASHSACEGRINEEHLFYLMSRGVSEEASKRLITLGYLNPILPLIFNDELRKSVENAILTRL